MPLTRAQHAAFEHLVAQPGPVTWAGPPSPSGWAASIRDGGGEGADPATVRLVKSRAFPGCHLHEADFASRDGRVRHMLVRTWQRPDGAWVADPAGGHVTGQEAHGVTPPARVAVLGTASHVLAEYDEFGDLE